MSSNVNVHGSETKYGSLTYYSFNVIDKKTGKVIESKSYTNRQEAEDYLNKQKQNYPDGSFNNKPLKDADPFNDDTFIDQSDTSGESAQVPTIPEQQYDKNGNPIPPSATSETLQVKDLGAKEIDLESFATNDDNKNPNSTSKLTKAAIDYCGIESETLKAIKSLATVELQKNVEGTLGAKRVQCRVQRKNYDCEFTMQGPDNNAFIVLGNDRTSNLSDPGAGEKGHTQCDAIDIVAGLGGYCPQAVEKIEEPDPATGEKIVAESPVETNPNFFIDAARIYISQKTNCDRNFGIGKFSKIDPKKEEVRDPDDVGKYGGKSAVIAKADNIRLIGRESIRIVTGTDQFNSVGGKISGKHGIELIAMNKVEDLQPLVKGQNLALALTIILNNIEAITEIFQAYVDYQMKFNKALSEHTHITKFYGKESLPSTVAMVGGIECGINTMMKTQLSVVKQITNLQGVKANFLSPSGDAYIMSKLNKTN